MNQVMPIYHQSPPFVQAHVARTLFHPPPPPPPPVFRAPPPFFHAPPPPVFYPPPPTHSYGADISLMNGGKGCCGYTHTHETVTEEKPGKPGQGFLGDLFDGALGFVGKVLEAPFKLAIKCSKVPIGLVGAIGKGLSGLSAGLLDGIGSIWK